MNEQFSQIRFTASLIGLLLVVAWGMLKTPSMPEGDTFAVMNVSLSEAANLATWAAMALLSSLY